jgi:hypothetical protein
MQNQGSIRANPPKNWKRTLVLGGGATTTFHER